MPAFGYTVNPKQIKEFVRNKFAIDPEEDGEKYAYLGGELVVYFGSKQVQETPSVAIFKSATKVAKNIYASMKKEFSEPDKKVVLHSLGADFYKEYFGEDPP